MGDPKTVKVQLRLRAENTFQMAQMAVREFHRTFYHPVATEPKRLEKAEFDRRIGWMREEINELEASGNIIDDVDALADLIYFALGFFVEMGVDGSKIFEIVHKANMDKLREGEVKYRSDGKVHKPDDWVSPEEKIREYFRSLGVPDKLLGEE